MAPAPRPRPLGGRLLLVLASLLIGGGALEVAFRLLDLKAPRLDQAAPRASERPPSEWNADGFHDVAWRRAKAPGTWRLLMVGDSFTAGHSVAREELFVKRVEALLNAHAGADQRYELFNVAQRGWDTAKEIREIKRLHQEGYQPDAACLVFFLNDATNLDSNPRLVRRINEALYRRERWWNRWSWAADYAEFVWRRRSVTRRTLADYRDSFHGKEKSQEHWALCQRALLRGRDFAAEQDMPLGLAVFPVLFQLHPDHELLDLYDMVEDHCRELGIPTVNLLPAFYGHESRELWVSPSNAHPNGFANGLVAPLLAKFLVEAGLVPRPARWQG